MPHTDVTAVHDLIDHGQLREAMRRCSGPVLPDSQAPAVVRLREETRAQLRTAVIERGDPVLLLERAQDADCHDDIVLWRACLAALPPGSPRRAGVVAHLDQLDQELGGG
jgi:hypothetical protein